MRRLVFASLSLSLLGAIAAVPASGAVLYDNTTAASNSTNAEVISNGQSITDSFTLSQAAVVDGATFSIWVNQTDTLTGLDWAIVTDPTGATTLDSGAATDITGPLVGTAAPYNIYQESTSIPSLSLGAGTYYLELSNGTTDADGYVFWDMSDGLSTADCDNSPTCVVPSETFQILGTEVTSSVPEPATWAMFLIGFGAIGWTLRGRRNASAATA
jgi:hypothetical protein